MYKSYARFPGFAPKHPPHLTDCSTDGHPQLIDGWPVEGSNNGLRYGCPLSRPVDRLKMVVDVKMQGNENEALTTSWGMGLPIDEIRY